uniref:Uncharacterized protein n=1 Tax=Brassica campestris TaxID=3711 RepID=M4EC85_BRACM
MSSHRLTREQKGKGAVSSRDSAENPDTREQFRGDDDGQEAVDISVVPISYYPGNIFTEESPLEVWRIRPSVVDVGHPNLATYPEDWKESARIVALQKQDHWEDFTRERIQRSVDRIASQRWISDSFVHLNRLTSKRLSLFTQAEQKEINRARTMKQLPDLSLIVAGKIGAKKGTAGSKAAPSEPGVAATTPIASEQTLAGVSSQQKNFQKKKREVDTWREAKEERNIERAGAEGSSKKGSKKRKAGDLSSGDIPEKKKMKKKDSAVPRPSSVCEEELHELVPTVAPEVGTSDDEDETIALRQRRREKRSVDGGSRKVSVDDQGVSGNPREPSDSEGQRGPVLGESPTLIVEGSETRVVGRPKETPEDGFKFEFKRDLPLAFHPGDCGRLLQLIKGGPDQLPPVKDLVFRDEYEHAASSSIKFLIDEIWRQIDPFGSNVDLIDSEAAAALRTPFVDRASRSEDLMREPSTTAVSATRNADENVNLAEQKSADAAIPKDGNVPTIVLTDSSAKASKNVSSSTSSSEDPVKKDGAPADRSIDATMASVDLPAQTQFGRVSGPGEEDGDGGKNPPVDDE